MSELTKKGLISILYIQMKTKNKYVVSHRSVFGMRGREKDTEKEEAISIIRVIKIIPA